MGFPSWKLRSKAELLTMILLLFILIFVTSSVSMDLSPPSEPLHHDDADNQEKKVEVDSKASGWTALDPDSEDAELSREVSLKLLEEFSDETFEDPEIVSVDIQRVGGRNYRVCLRTEDRDFQLVVSYTLRGSIRDGTTGATLTGIKGITTKFETFLDDRDSFVCVKTYIGSESREEITSEEHPDYPPPSLRRTSSASTARFKYTKKNELPESFDWREMYDEKCKNQIEQIYDQGACGACYAWATVTSLADRVCLSRAKRGDPSPKLLRLSVQDLIACGSRDHGDICMVLEGGAQKSTRFANGCDGWLSTKAFEYAVKRGLKEESCHPYELHSDKLDDDVIVPNHRFACVAVTTKELTPLTAICVGVGELKLSTPDSELTLLGPASQFCSCAEDKRQVKFNGEFYSGWGDGEVFSFKRRLKSKSDCTVSKPSIEKDDDLIELSCTDISETTEDEDMIKIRPFEGLKDREATVNLGPIDWVTSENARLMSNAGRICRCSDDGKEGKDWDRVSLKEVGHNALSGSCNRAKMKGHCQKTYRFADVTKLPQGELMTKAAIYTGGPIVATINLHISMYNFDSQYDEKIYQGIPESNDAYSEHAIVLFGWGVDDSTNEKFWWARNSWGDSWPENTNTPGIFKVSRGQNRNNIETKERAFANAILDHEAKEVSELEQTCESLRKSISMTSKQREALECLEIQNKDASVHVRNKCDKDVLIVKEVSNSLGAKKKKQMCGVVFDGTTLPRKVSQTINMISDLCIIQAMFLPGYPSCVEINHVDGERSCTLNNRCHREIRVMQRGKRNMLIKNLPIGRKVSIEKMYCDEKNIHTDWGLIDDDSDIIDDGAMLHHRGAEG